MVIRGFLILCDVMSFGSICCTYMREMEDDTLLLRYNMTDRIF